MTYEEAIAEIKELLKTEIDKLPYHHDAEFNADVYDSMTELDKILKLNKIVSKALEKQIPKTPKIFKEKYMQPDYLCPICDADVDPEWDCCAGCGQALNWEGVFE